MQEEELIQLHTMFAQMKNEMGKELPGEQVFFVRKDKKVIQKLRGWKEGGGKNPPFWTSLQPHVTASGRFIDMPASITVIKQ